MTKKRVKFGLAILGGLTAFLLALLALVFAPTGASAGKGPVFGQEQDGGGQSDHPNLAYFEPPTGTGPSHGPGHSEDGVSPCVGTLCDTQDNDAQGDETWRYADGEGGPGGNSQGGAHSPDGNSGDHSQGGNGNPWLFAGGGYPGGGGGGAPQSNCSSQKDKDQDSKDTDSGDEKTCDTDNQDGSTSGSSGNNGDNTGNGGNGAGFEQLTLLDDKNSDPNDDKSGDPSGDTNTDLVVNSDSPPGDDDPPPVDPNCFPFTEGCNTHNGNPPNGNPPDTVLTDPPNQVPEPLTLSLFAAGLTGAAVLRRRQKKAVRPD